MRKADTEVYVTGDIEDLSRGGAISLDTIEQLSRLPKGYDAGIWSDAVEVIGPAVRQGRVGR